MPKNNEITPRTKNSSAAGTPAGSEMPSVKILKGEAVEAAINSEQLSYSQPEIFIYDFLFVRKTGTDDYQRVLDEVFMSYFRERPFFSQYGYDEQRVHQAYHFFTLLCRHRGLIVQTPKMKVSA